ncbi:MAG: RsmE family RNA methyltransferase, partial [Phenylobacterium sp.]|nr:RsmE family RNA methyltransferase [Phenylobacterium sp.]
LVLTERTNPEHIRLSRLNAIATEAAEQTGRIDLPEIFEPIRLSAVLDDWEASRRLLFCDEAGDAPPVLDALRGQHSGPWAVLIGPEGGFSPAERERLRSLDQAVPASLGPRILRADTAAISALTLWQSACGDWRDHAASD